MCKTRCLVNLIVCGIQLSIADIIHNRTGKQMSILQDNSQRTAEIILFNLCDVNSVVADLSFLNIIKTIDQVGDRSLSGSCGTYKSKLLSRLCIQADIFQDYFIFIVAKGHILKNNISGQLCIGNRTVCRMRMFPCPHSCALLTFCNISVFVLSGIYKSHITFIFFRLLVDQLENTLCSCKRHNNGVKLLSHLHKRLSKAFCKLKVGSHNSKSDSAYSDNRKETAQNCCKNKLKISDISDYRSHHICKSICSGSAFKKSFV